MTINSQQKKPDPLSPALREQVEAWVACGEHTILPPHRYSENIQLSRHARFFSRPGQSWLFTTEDLET